MAGYLATVAGVILGSAYRGLHPKPTAGGRIDDFGALASDIFRSRDLWAGLVASPLVFGLLYRTLDDAALSGLVVLGLENGFCCHISATRELGRYGFATPDARANGRRFGPMGGPPTAISCCIGGAGRRG